MSAKLMATHFFSRTDIYYGRTLRNLLDIANGCSVVNQDDLTFVGSFDKLSFRQLYVFIKVGSGMSITRICHIQLAYVKLAKMPSIL